METNPWDTLDWFLYDRDLHHERIKDPTLNLEISDPAKHPRLSFFAKIVNRLLRLTPHFGNSRQIA